MKLIGLTGGIGCGKSTVAELLKEKGWGVVDSDQIAHRLMEPDAVNWQKIVDSFGEKVLNPDRTINRKILGGLIFGEPHLRHQLNAITHPAIRQTWQSEVRYHQKSHPYGKLLVMIPLLFEVGLEGEFSQVICVACSARTQWSRLERRGLSTEEAKKRIESQKSLQEKMKLSQWVIWNEGTLEGLREQVERLNRNCEEILL